MPNYINGVKLKETRFSIRFSGKTEDVIEQLREHTNDKGYFNLEIKKRREPGKYGETHYIEVSEWKPEQKEEKKAPEVKQANDSLDLPF